jgi:hypothetical protein
MVHFVKIGPLMVLLPFIFVQLWRGFGGAPFSKCITFLVDSQTILPGYNVIDWTSSDVWMRYLCTGLGLLFFKMQLINIAATLSKSCGSYSSNCFYQCRLFIGGIPFQYTCFRIHGANRLRWGTPTEAKSHHIFDVWFVNDRLVGMMQLLRKLPNLLALLWSRRTNFESVWTTFDMSLIRKLPRVIRIQPVQNKLQSIHFVIIFQ